MPRTGDSYDFAVALSAARDAADPEAAAVEPVHRLHVVHAAHIVAAAAGFVGDPRLQAHASVRRQQHIWLLQNWAMIELMLLEEETPIDLALYLALGWMQCTSTAVWPATPRWRVLLAGTPPAHWWPRVQWLLVWLLHAPDNRERRTALDAALSEGAADATLGRLARDLRAAL
jgi:hypothetical protein